MSSKDANIIKFLLGAILLVLLFGREAVVASFQTGIWGLAGFGILLVVGWIAWTFGKAFLYDVPKEYITDLKKEKAEGKSWLYGLFLGIGLPFGLAWIAGMMLHKYRLADIREYTDLAGYIWYVLAPIALGLYLWDGLKRRYREIPGVIATIFRKWGYVAVSPVLAPIGRIQEFKAQRAVGTFRGYTYAVFDILMTFIVSLALWIFAVIVPLIFVAILYHEGW
jgi:hypothetical protein